MKTTMSMKIALSILSLFASPLRAQPISFVNFGSFFTEEPTTANVEGLGRHDVGPTVWYTGDATAPMPGWDEFVRWEWTANYLSPFEPTGEDPLIIAAPFVSHSTIIASDADGNVTGTMELEGNGILAVDLRLDSAVVDEVSGQIMTPYFNTVSGFDEPAETYTILDRTGIFSSIEPVGEWKSFITGLNARPIFSGQDLADAALNPIITSHSTLTIEGQYQIVPEPSTSVLLWLGIAGMLLRRKRELPA